MKTLGTVWDAFEETVYEESLLKTIKGINEAIAKGSFSVITRDIHLKVIDDLERLEYKVGQNFHEGDIPYAVSWTAFDARDYDKRIAQKRICKR